MRSPIVQSLAAAWESRRRPALAVVLLMTSVGCIPLAGGPPVPLTGGPPGTPHGLSSEARVTFQQAGQTTTYPEGSAYYDPASGYLGLTGIRPFSLQTATTPARIYNREHLSLSTQFTGGTPATLVGKATLTRWDAEGNSSDIWSDPQTRLAIDRFDLQGTGPWGAVFTASGHAEGTDSQARPFAVTFDVRVVQR